MMALEHAILATILHEPKTGYDLAKQFGASGYFWRATHQQIYREIARMDLKGLVAPADEEIGVRGNKMLAITEVGRIELGRWARNTAEPATIKEELLVKCLTLGLLPRGDLIEQLNERRQHHSARLQRYEEASIRQFPPGLPLDDARLGRYLALLGGISYERAWIEWAELAIRLLKG